MVAPLLGRVQAAVVMGEGYSYVTSGAASINQGGWRYIGKTLG